MAMGIIIHADMYDHDSTAQVTIRHSATSIKSGLALANPRCDLIIMLNPAFTFKQRGFMLISIIGRKKFRVNKNCLLHCFSIMKTITVFLPVCSVWREYAAYSMNQDNN